MALVLGKQVWVESELAHPTHESVLIGAIPRSPAGHSALVVQLVERLPERQQRVGGRGEAELPVRLETFPLGDQVEAQAAGAPFRLDAVASDLSDCFTSTPDYDGYQVRKEDARIFDPAAAREPLDPRPSVKMDDPAEGVR